MRVDTQRPTELEQLFEFITKDIAVIMKERHDRFLQRKEMNALNQIAHS